MQNKILVNHDLDLLLDENNPQWLISPKLRDLINELKAKEFELMLCSVREDTEDFDINLYLKILWHGFPAVIKVTEPNSIVDKVKFNNNNSKSNRVNNEILTGISSLKYSLFSCEMLNLWWGTGSVNMPCVVVGNTYIPSLDLESFHDLIQFLYKRSDFSEAIPGFISLTNEVFWLNVIDLLETNSLKFVSSNRVETKEQQKIPVFWRKIFKLFDTGKRLLGLN